jgi:hypothetical protein
MPSLEPPGVTEPLEMIDGLLLVLLTEEEHQATAQGWIIDIEEELRKLAAAVACHEEDHIAPPPRK